MPTSRTLLEDRARAEIATVPAKALADFQAAACGAPCLEGEGDAQLRLGHARAAIRDYVQARAVARLNTVAREIAGSGDIDGAIYAERQLAAKFSDRAVDQASLARTLWQIARFEELGAYKLPRRAVAYRADAIALLRRAATIAPYNESYLLELGYAQMQWGDRNAARRAFERLLELHPHFWAAERGMRVLNQHGQTLPRTP